MKAETDYEARYLELASRPGMETLKQGCPRKALHSHRHGVRCAVCGGLGWLPLPEAERLGALVRVAGYVTVWWRVEEECWAAEVHGGAEYNGPTPEAALTEALLAATADVGIGAQGRVKA